MHIERPSTDQQFEITVLVNNQPSSEYVLPSSVSSDGYIDTYIAVRPGDRLTVKCCFTGSILHGHFDLVADGTLCKESRIEGDSVTGAVKHVKRHISFDKGLDCPTPDDWVSSEPPPHVYEGELIVSESIGDEALQEMNGGSRPGVGSLIVVASVNQNTLENYHDPEKSIEMRSWTSRKGEEVRKAEIPPEYVLELRLVEDKKVTSRRSLLHRKIWQQTRFGAKPWGKFCFHYRSLESIQRAGGTVRRDDQVLQVEAWDGEEGFVFAAPGKKAVPKRKNMAAAGDEEGEDGLVPIKQERQESVMDDRAVTPKAKKKKAKLGGALFGSAQRSKDDIPAATTEHHDEDEGYPNSDIEATGAELGNASNVNPSQNDHGNANSASENNSTNEPDINPIQELTYVDQKSSGVSSASAPVNDGPATWAFPAAASTPPAQKLVGTLGSAQGANAVISTASKPSHSLIGEVSPLAKDNIPDTTALSTNMASTSRLDPQIDRVRLPALTQIRGVIDDDDDTGTPLTELDELFNEHGPYGDAYAARVEFDKKVSSIAEQRSDKNFYLRSDENTSRAERAKAAAAAAAAASLTAKGASRGSPTPIKASPAKREGASARRRGMMTATQVAKAAANSPALEEDTKHKATTTTTTTTRRSPRRRRRETSAQPSAAAMPKHKLSHQFSPSGLSTPAKRSIASSTPGAGLSSGAARKQKLARLKKELAAKEAREKEAKDRVAREEAMILEVERKIQEVDRKWVEEYDSGRVGEEEEEEEGDDDDDDYDDEYDEDVGGNDEMDVDVDVDQYDSMDVGMEACREEDDASVED